MEWLIISGIAAALMFAGKGKSKKTTTDSSITPDPLNIDSMVPTSASDSSASSKFSDATVLPSGTPKYGAPATSASKFSVDNLSKKESGKAGEKAAPKYYGVEESQSKGKFIVTTQSAYVLFRETGSPYYKFSSYSLLIPIIPTSTVLGRYTGKRLEYDGAVYYEAEKVTGSGYLYVRLPSANKLANRPNAKNVLVSSVKDGRAKYQIL